MAPKARGSAASGAMLRMSSSIRRSRGPRKAGDDDQTGVPAEATWNPAAKARRQSMSSVKSSIEAAIVVSSSKEEEESLNSLLEHFKEHERSFSAEARKARAAAQASTSKNDEAMTVDSFLEVVETGHLEEIQRLLDSVSEEQQLVLLNTKGESGKAALFIAFENEYPEVMGLFLQRGGNPFLTNGSGLTPLGLSVLNHWPYRERLLLAVMIQGHMLDRGETLYEVIRLATAVEKRAVSLRVYDTFKADELTACGNRLQLTLAACISMIGELKDGHGRFEVDQLLLSPKGTLALDNAIRNGCKLFAVQPPVQAFLRRRWRGSLLNAIYDQGELHWRLAGAAAYIFFGSLNFALLPFCALIGPPFQQKMRKELDKQHTSLLHELRRASSKKGTLEEHTDGVIMRKLHAEHLGWPDAFLLDTPFFKFVLASISDVALVLMNEPGISIGNEYPEVLLIWSATALFNELFKIGNGEGGLKRELLSFVSRDVQSAYRSDMFNLVDLTALTLYCVSNAIHFYVPEEERTAESFDVLLDLRSLAQVALWLRLVRICTLSVTMGPLVLMMVRMLVDVLKIYALLLMLFLFLSSGITTLYESPGAEETAEETDCLIYRRHSGAATTIPGGPFQRARVVFALANAALLPDEAYARCFLLHEHWLLAWIYIYGFFILSAVLLLNMLIAMMAKTFDNVWDMQALNHQFMFAQNVASWRDAEPAPPPLSALRLPSRILYFLAGCCGADAENGAGMTSSSAKKRRQWLKSIPDFAGCEVHGRNSWAVWKNYHPPEGLADAIEAFLTAHEDDVAQEDRWRVKLMKRMTLQFNMLKRSVNVLHEERHDIQLLRHSLDEMREERHESAGGGGKTLDSSSPAAKWLLQRKVVGGMPVGPSGKDKRHPSIAALLTRHRAHNAPRKGILHAAHGVAASQPADCRADGRGNGDVERDEPKVASVTFQMGTCTENEGAPLEA